MSIRILPDYLVNQIAAGEVVERPASVIKELIENALDAGAENIFIEVTDAGRTLISVIDDGKGMMKNDLIKSIQRHATSKLPNDDLLNINFMGFRGEALPSIASVSDMTIDTKNSADAHGWVLDSNTGQIKPSSWEFGTRIKIENLFAKVPARLKFMRTDRGEMMAIVDTVKRLAMSRVDVGFTLNNKYRYKKGDTLQERIISIMGEDLKDKMISINQVSGSDSRMSISGFISQPTLRRASSIDQYLFVNNRPVKDKALIGALRAAYMDVMNSREFPICALYLTLDPKTVDVNVSPSKTEVHFLEPSHVRSFIIKTIRTALSKTMTQYTLPNTANYGDVLYNNLPVQGTLKSVFDNNFMAVKSIENHFVKNNFNIGFLSNEKKHESVVDASDPMEYKPLGQVIGQIANKYIITESRYGLIIVDQHAAHERIVYEQMRIKAMKLQPLLTPIVISMKPEYIDAILMFTDEISELGISLDKFGEDAIAVFQKPADWDLNWDELLHAVADEILEYGHSSYLHEKLHLKLANYACHHSVRAGQKLDYAQMDALLRDVENTERGGQCNHGRPVYKIITINELDALFERL